MISNQNHLSIYDPMGVQTIAESNFFNPVDGETYTAKFVRIESSVNKEGKPTLKWVFTLSDDPTIEIWAFCDPATPTKNNKNGRWLMGLAGKSLKAGTQISPNEYVGQEYLLYYEKNNIGNITLNSITKI